MKVARFDAFPVRVPYRQNEQSSVVNTAGVSAVIVRLETDDGLVGWGECDTAADTASVEAAVRSAMPFVLGSDPWRGEQVFDRVLVERSESESWKSRAQSLEVAAGRARRDASDAKAASQMAAVQAADPP